MSAPTICRTCGGRIERPAHDGHICEYCETDMKAPLKTDNDDLTPLIVRLPFELEREREPVWIGVLLVSAMMTLAGGIAAVFVYWLGKQAGLWGGL